MRFKQFFQMGILLLLSALLTIGCQTQREKNMETDLDTTDQDIYNMDNNMAPKITEAIAVLHATEGNNVTGTVKFSKEGDKIKVVADVSGLTPGKHGFHIHEYGDCSALDAKSAGGHFNPEGVAHGAPQDETRHVGDLGNLEADDNGTAHYEWTDSFISFSGAHSIIGRAVIVHQGEDDYVSQPTGNAGARVACGVIGIAAGK